MLTFFAEDNDDCRATLEPDAVLAWSCVATSYNEAQEQLHASRGWEPYKFPEEWNE